MSPRLRVVAAVALAALAAAGAVVGVTLATRQTPEQPHARAGKPPAVVDLPSRSARQIRAAFRSWPGDGLQTLERLGTSHPRDPVVQFNLGLARLWAGYDGDAVTAFRAAKRVGRDTIYQELADNLLHPQYFQGYPPFQPTRPNDLLVAGARAQSEHHQETAERLYGRAAQRAPGDDEAQVAAAIGLYDKDDTARAFGRLGPLTARFPHSQTVRFHLALLLAWQGDRPRALRWFRAAARLGPNTVLGREANAFLTRLGAGTK
jgi:tetratricopeptide (TPR) repeat protein